MSNRLTIVFSGRKQSGKNSTANYILAKFLNLQMQLHGKSYCYDVDPVSGRLFKLVANVSLGFSDDPDSIELVKGYGAKIYSFADPLKRFCIDVLGVTEEGCYGTDAQKNAIVPHLLWESFPIQEAVDGRTGPMTGREVMQLFGTEVVRKFYHDAWARGTYSAIQREGYELALVCDGRFPNEIDMGSTVGSKSIRMMRKISDDNHPSETSLDNFPIDRYTLAIDNRTMSMQEQFEFIDPFIETWFREAKIAEVQNV